MQFRFIVAAISAVVAISSGSPVRAADPFTVVLLPDTQYYVEQSQGATMAMFHAQTQYIVNNASAKNIVYVTHVGDITNNGASDVQWQRAAEAMYRLDSIPDLRWGTVTGNHDITGGGLAKYLAYFGPGHFAGRQWASFGGAGSASSYQTFTAGGRTYLGLCLQYGADTSAADLNWAKQVLDSHPGMPTILTTHDYLSGGGTSAARSAPGQRLWDNLIKLYDQIFLVLSGHNPSPGMGRRVDNNNFGHPVFQMYACYQGWSQGGYGLMRELTFDEGGGRIRVHTHSPWNGAVLTDDGNRFDLYVNFNDRFGPANVVPEPLAATMLAAAAALACLRRRRA